MPELKVFNTAYEEALINIQSGKDLTGAGVPSYITASDTLNTANRNKSFLESASDTAASIPKFIGASIISGVNQLYNIPADVGNLFGGDFERSDTGDVISSLDSDLGKFYEDHKEGSDLVGFIASSIVPGVGGIKVLNAGQRSLNTAIGAGKFGTNTGKALGLLAPQRQKALSKAIGDVTNNSGAVSLLNRNALNAMGAGLGQNVLEAAAFEVAVAGTLFNSPVLEGQDFGDFLSNVAWGAGVFGIVGGAVDAAKISFKLNKAAKASDIEARPWTFIAETSEASSTYEKIALDFEQLHAIPPIPAGASAERGSFLAAARDTKINTLDLRIRKQIGVLANGDEDVASVLHESFKRAGKEEQQGAFIGLQETARLTTKTKLEKEMGSLKKKVNSGKASTEEIDAFANMSLSYAKTWGEGAGRVTTEAPVITSLVDTLKKGERIKVTATGVTAGKRKFRFEAPTKIGKKDPKPWNMLAADPLEANARYIWASKLPPFKPTASKPLIVDMDDIPLMEKLMADVTDPEALRHVSLRTPDGGLVSAASRSLQDTLAATKISLANRLERATSQELIGSSAAVTAQKLRTSLGINFHVSDLADSSAIAKLVNKGGVDSIEVNKKFLASQPIHKLVSSILHEDGYRQFNDIIDLGAIPKDAFPALKSELVSISKTVRADAWRNVKEGSEKWQYLNDTHELMADAFSYFSKFPARMEHEGKVFKELYGSLVKPIPTELVDSYAKRATRLTQDEIASMVNVRSSYLSGELTQEAVEQASLRDILALQSHAEDYTKRLVGNGTRKPSDPAVDIWNIPQHAKLAYSSAPFRGMDNFVVENMATIKTQQKLYQEATSRASAGVLGEDYARLPDINSTNVYKGANRGGAGAGFASAASANYGTLANKVEQIGAVTSRAIERFKTRSRDSLEPLLYRLGQNDEAAIEWSTLNARVRSIEEQYALNAAGDALEPIKLLRWRKAAQEATEAGQPIPARPTLAAADTPARLELTTPEVRELAAAHINLNSSRTSDLSSIRSAQGAMYHRDPSTFYPIPVNPKDFPHFALVSDSSITQTGHTKTLFASSAEELDGMIAKLKQNPQLTIRTKGEAEEYFKSVGQWDYEKTLNDNYLDTAAHRKGISAPFLVPTDPKKITTDMLNWHLDRETGLVREAVSAKYEVQFEELRRLGDQYTNVATSKFSSASLLRYADDVIQNPYADYIKTALGIRKTSDYPWWVNPNRMADEAVSKLLKRATGAVESAKTPQQLEEVNRLLAKGGYKGAAYDEQMEIFANADPARGALTSTIQKANSILATVVLRWDALNAMNNAVSANVLLGAETKAVVRAIGRGDKEAVGALAEVSKIKVPGVPAAIMSPTKMISNAMAKFGRDTPEMAFYRANGFVTSISDQYKNTLDNLTFTGKESVRNWDDRVMATQAKLSDLASKGEKWTGNRLAEEFNRFVAADVMKQMTDVAVARKLMSSKEQLAYINTFVNRTQGNYLAAQRPMMFQGPVGQAIGLFQTYQFNLIQQLLRHVGEGHAKDSMSLLALQGTIHGMNGLPAFNAINTHLLGNASGNVEHRDAYDAVYGAAGKEGGDWLMYGIGSNMLGLIHPDLKMNLYTRGDINPRHVTIVPTDPASVPIVQATGKFLGNIFNTASKIAAGGDVSTTLLQGLEHNSISRPLAGLAVTLEGFNNPQKASYSTSRKGNVIAANDLLTLTNLGRIAGGKPLDEAVALDATYRYKAYGLADAKKRATLGQAIKTTLIAGQEPTTEQIENFAQRYAEVGGRQEEFNKWFTQLYKTANLSQANKMSRDLGSPFSQSMQKIMGGEELRDFSRPVPADSAP